MIAPAVIDSIERLLAEGRLSQRKIAKTLGVSRGTVAGVASGRRPDYEQLRRRREENEQPILLGPLARCRECGGMVHVPCRLCALRGQLAGEPRRPTDRRPTEPLALELRGDARARYEAVHRQRMQQGEPCERDATDLPNGENEWPDDDEDWL